MSLASHVIFLYTSLVVALVFAKYLDEKRDGFLWFGHMRAKEYRSDIAFLASSSPPMPKKLLLPVILAVIKLYQIDLAAHLLVVRALFVVAMMLKFQCLFVILSAAAGQKQEYDQGEAKKMLMWAFLNFMFSCGVHYRYGHPAPLIIQCVLALDLFDAPLFKLHLLGIRNNETLTRPFKPPPSVLEWLNGPTEVPAAKDQKDAKLPQNKVVASVGGIEPKTKALPDLVEPRTKMAVPAVLELPGGAADGVCSAVLRSLGCGVRVRKLPIIGAVQICEHLLPSCNRNNFGVLS
jgi:hypothetical protein